MGRHHRVIRGVQADLVFPVVLCPGLVFYHVPCASLSSAGHIFPFCCQQYLFDGCNKESVCEFGVNRAGSVQPDSCRTPHPLNTAPAWTALTWLQAQPSENTITSRNAGWVRLYVIMKLMRSVISESLESTDHSHPGNFYPSDYICWFLH